jgi:hypothetical protein
MGALRERIRAAVNRKKYVGSTSSAPSVAQPIGGVHVSVPRADR